MANSFYMPPWLTQEQYLVLKACVDFATNDLAETEGDLGNDLPYGHVVLEDVEALNTLLDKHTGVRRTPCGQSPYFSSDHCGDMACWNYINKCRLHCIASRTDDAPCSLERT